MLKSLIALLALIFVFIVMPMPCATGPPAAGLSVDSALMQSEVASAPAVIEVLLISPYAGNGWIDPMSEVAAISLGHIGQPILQTANDPTNESYCSTTKREAKTEVAYDIIVPNFAENWMSTRAENVNYNSPMVHGWIMAEVDYDLKIITYQVSQGDVIVVNLNSPAYLLL